MGYQALLFCPDEKLARVVSQVFAELDFTIELVQEPFAAVKRLMAQHYDAVVVDCDNETNAALLFKSARNSSSNQSSLAIAVVEGQAGVAKAYRIGANLVLTKPINVEQAKGTLRVARGLLRKTSDVAPVANANPPAAPAPPVTPPAAPVAPVRAATPSVARMSVPVNKSALPEFETPLPAMAASAAIAEPPVVPPVREVAAAAPVATPPVVEAPVRPAPEPARIQAPPVAPKPIESPAASLAPAHGAAAAPAPARELPPERKTVEFEAAYQKDDSPLSPATTVDAPTFAALDDEPAAGSGRAKNALVAAAIILALAALGYVGWSRFSASNSRVTAPAVSEPQQQPPPQPNTPPTAAPMSAPVTAPSTGTTNRAAGSAPAGTAKTAVASSTAPAAADSSPVLRLDMTPEAQAKKPGVAPILVKSAPAQPSSARTEEATALPNPLAVAESNQGSLSSLTVPTSQSQPSLVKVNISQGVSQGLLIKRVQPKYPPNALSVHIQGAVLLQAIIDKEGKITNLKVLKGDIMLARAAVDAVKQWRYKPYYLDGVPVDIQTEITINFKLPN